MHTGTLSLSALAIIPALGLLQYIRVTCNDCGDRVAMMFSALLPEPDANITIDFMRQNR
jgi:hypothetical protein